MSPPTDFKSVASADTAIAPGRYILLDERISSSNYVFSLSGGLDFCSPVLDDKRDVEN